MQPASRLIEILAFANAQILDVTGPLQVFATANDLARERRAPPPYQVRVIATADGPLPTSCGLAVMSAPLPAADAPCDTLIVAGGWGVYDAADDVALVEWLRLRARHCRRVASVCTGAFLLAASGLLDGRRVATHWTRCEQLARRYPALTVEANPIFIEDGPIWTSAGVTAGIDLALALVEADLGRPLALEAARHLVVFLKRPGGQAQFSQTLALQRDDSRFGDPAVQLASAASCAIIAAPAARPRRAPLKRCASRRRGACCWKPACRSSASPVNVASAVKRPCAGHSCAGSMSRRWNIASALRSTPRDRGPCPRGRTAAGAANTVRAYR
jgi:transcriptional regulator GlxA family with amidase domain